MFKWPSYSFSEAANDMQVINTQNMIEVHLSDDFMELRNELIDARDEVFDKYGFDSGLNKKYMFDLEFGLRLYQILQGKIDNRTASLDDVWRYLSIKVIPDVIHARHGRDENRYYKNSRRIYLKQIWWYIHISWLGNFQDTFEILKRNTTDTVQSIVERPGLGYNVPLYREIMKQYAKYANENNSDRIILRRVMKLNTARIKLISPELYPNGISAYVNSLFNDVIS
ncbi:hypothetical protein ACWOA0_07930 [Ignavigranum ruoffiae]